MSATIQFKKDYRRDLVYIEQGDDLTALHTYAHQLNSYSTADITSLAVTTKQVVAMTGAAGEHAAVTIQAKLSVRDLDTNKLWGIVIPAPIAFMFEEVTGQGYRVKQSIGEQITSYFAIYAGMNFKFEEGWLVGGK